MAAQYDAIAREYQRTKESPLRRYVEAYSFMQMAGDVAGRRVLDLACGEGFYSRLLKRAGAETVTGVDISAGMIDLAEQLERDEPLGIDYLCRDVAQLDEPGALGRYDLVTAAYLLHYAPNTNQLQQMCNNIARHLEPGGRFLAINENPEQTVADYQGYTQYGFNKTVTGERYDGTAIHYAMVSGRSMIRFDAYYYSAETYEHALRKAGFASVSWRPLQLDPAGEAECGHDYWQEYLANPPVTGLECSL
jgi:ubiquinone/menaquinone biosynthesis C-methylase UbiE